jgi:hypothetical protein
MTVQSRYQKAVVTRSINRYIKKGLLILKISVDPYQVIITPNSKYLLVTIDNNTERVTPKTFSDYVSKSGTFGYFITSFRKAVK